MNSLPVTANRPRGWAFGAALFTLALLTGSLTVARAQNEQIPPAPIPPGLPGGTWSTGAPLPGIRPDFAREPQGGRDGQPALVIRTDRRPGLNGFWVRRFPVTGGKYYRFRAFYRARHVPVPRREVVVRLLWRNSADHWVPLGLPVFHDIPGYVARAETEFPATRGTDANGWTEVSDVYHVPDQATWAVVEFHLRWATDAEVRWSGITMEEVPPPQPRLVRLAAVNFRPTGRTPMENCESYAPDIAEAAAQHADLVVLGEMLTYYGLHRTFAQVAEPIPGPSTEYFGKLARKYNLYIVPGLIERDHGLLYNTAVLIGPDGRIVGKYRKVVLTDAEIAAGITPGNSYPVFNTRFGKVGMMICYDGYFPEVARQLEVHGAEVIAWPVWGCSPRLAAARAIDNQVYLVSSTYATPENHWMVSGIWGRDGRVIAQGHGWGTVAVATVNLNAPTYWTYLGNFKACLARQRPVAVGEPTLASADH